METSVVLKKFTSISEKTNDLKLKWLRDGEKSKVVVKPTTPVETVPLCVKEYPLEFVDNYELLTLTRLAKRPAIDVKFTDLTYTVNNHSTKGGRQILRSISGEFKSGELTAIMGTSGAGKSTLMNILAGYVSSGVTGLIHTNNRPRDLKVFNKLSTYIMQDDLLQVRLSVEEAMLYSARLKLGTEVTAEQKIQIRDEIISMLGLEKCRRTKTENLSGGQRKRLSVALELVNNPPVIFLDEPTSGLDIFAIKQLMNLLKLLARQGRTIICTIHQPTASIYQQFDHVYVLGRGQCVYQGSHDQLVPFLSSVGFNCPITYNPADYVIEQIQGETNKNIAVLSSAIQNGKMNMKSKEKSKHELTSQESVISLPKSYSDEFDDNVNKLNVQFPTSFWTQFWILLTRMYTQRRRNTTSLWIMLFHHTVSGTLIGSTFLGVGNDGSRPFDIFKFVLCVVVFFMYTRAILPSLLFPIEVKILQREFFNRWYGLKPYYLALSLSTVFEQFILGFLFSVICYLLSDQPLETERLAWFCAFGIAIGFVSEGLGMAVGSLFSIMNASAITPTILAPTLAVAVYGMGFGTVIEPLMKYLMGLSFIRYGLAGTTVSLLGNDRASLSCDVFYCHYKDPVLMLKDLGLSGFTCEGQLIGLFFFFLTFRIAAFFALRFRLTNEFSNHFLNYITKALRHR